jgi:predicted aldo/keto reductase-like oxidoreductase
MKTIRLGATALEISEIGFGGIPIIPLPQEEAVSVVRHCFDLGITFFDTANMYPTSEEKLGIALKSIRNKVGIIGMKPLGGGVLERANLCFRFLQRHPYVVPIPGIRAKKEADEIIDLYRNPEPLSEADLKDIETIRSALGEKFCHRCEYCMPCAQGVQIPSVLMFQAATKRLSREGVKGWIGKAMESVEQCIECGECEQKCPYHLPISDLLKENLALYNQYARS